MMFYLKFFLIAFILPTIIAAQRNHKNNASNNMMPSKDRMSSSPKRWCPTKCKCNFRKKEVNCAYKSLRSFPKDIPASTKRLILSGNKIKKLPQKKLALLRNLEVLELNGNYLEAVNVRLFGQLKKLKKLNLSFNKLTYIPSNSFKNSKNLKILLLRGNKLVKLSLDVFEGLNEVKEIDLSANSLQTLEFDIFKNLTSLKILFLDKNQWHCDCSLKETDTGLRERKVNTGFVICDSPKLFAGRQLSGLSVNSFCGTKVESLVYIVLGTISGIISILFLIFMCRRRIAPNLDLTETRNAISGKTKTGSLEDALSRSSLLYDSENDGSIPSREKPIDLLQTSRDLKTDVLPLTDDVKADNSATTPQVPILLTFQSNVQSCPDLVECSDKIDKFNDD